MQYVTKEDMIFPLNICTNETSLNKKIYVPSGNIDKFHCLGYGLLFVRNCAL